MHAAAAAASRTAAAASAIPGTGRGPSSSTAVPKELSCEASILHQSFSVLHAGSEHCAKTVLNVPGSHASLVLMAKAGRQFRHALEDVGYGQGWVSLTHDSSPFRWESFDLRSTTVDALRRAMRAPLFLSHRISVSGSRSCSRETIEADERCRSEARDDADSSDAQERELR